MCKKKSFKDVVTCSIKRAEFEHAIGIAIADIDGEMTIDIIHNEEEFSKFSKTAVDGTLYLELT